MTPVRFVVNQRSRLDNLAGALALHVAHYNFCRIHGTLVKTPTVASDVTNAPWTLAELIDKALGAK